jgi:hypothetical protein
MAEIDQQFCSLANRFRLMAGVQLNSEQMRQYLDSVFANWTKKTAKLKSPHSVREYESDLAECSRLFVEGKGNNLPGAQRTLWAAVGAVAEYVDCYKLKPSDPMYLNEIWFNELKGSALRVANQMLAFKLKKS